MASEIGLIPIVIICSIFASYIGVYAHKKGLSFWLGFTMSFLLSPVIGAITVVASQRNGRRGEYQPVRYRR